MNQDFKSYIDINTINWEAEPSEVLMNIFCQFALTTGFLKVKELVNILNLKARTFVFLMNI